jgi:hypothetical protein
MRKVPSISGYAIFIVLFVLSELWLEVIVLFLLSELWLEVIVLFVLSELWLDVIVLPYCRLIFDKSNKRSIKLETAVT